jgi:uncharacterized protein (TIGR01777 family)
VRDERIKGHDIAHWDPERGTIESERLVDIDAVVHLAGENLASGRWNTQRKARIRDSRVNGTLLLSETIAGLRPLPKVFLSASASGYYGDRNDEVLTEDSGSGDDFLANVVIEWESATKSASDVGIRVVTMRSGLVLHPDGGALKKMLPAFKLGIAGRLGDGMHYMPWITLHDMTRAILHILENDALVGPTIVATPNPVTNTEFTKSLGRAISRPTIFPMPRFILRLIFGEIADTVLASARMEPTKLLNSGFEFDHPELGDALREILSK